MKILFLFFMLSASLEAKGNGENAVQKNTILDYTADMNAVLNAGAYGSNVYIGISGRMYSRSRELEYAKMHIASQIAISRYCTVDYGYITIEESALNSHTAYDSNFDYDAGTMDEIIQNITIRKKYHFPAFTVLVAEYGETKPVLYPAGRNGSERPAWIRLTPEIEGYHVGVGMGDRYYSQYKSILIADINAAQNIAIEKHLFIRGYTYDYTSKQSQLKSGDVFLSRAELRGFYILDRWIDADGTCYSLAIAEKD